MSTSLLDLFLPPEGYFGDFGMLCGYTASKQVLERIKRNFSADTARPVLAAFIHPTKAAITDVPGLAWIWMGAEGKARDYGLLHAKVALLGFRALEGDGYKIRLAVTTGNWTADPLTTSIDLFWHFDLDTAAPDPQEVSDVRAAWQFFNWLRERGDCGLLTCSYYGHTPNALLGEKIAAMPESSRRPRFIDNRVEGLLPQVVARLSHRGRVADRLIIGSGYFESKKGRFKTVPEALMDALIRTKGLNSKTKPDLVLNPEACQGMAVSGKKLQDRGWTLRRPVSETHRGSDTKLHAKFALLATGGGNDQCIGRLYLGSGNMTPAGFEQAVSPKGNLEAGVVFDLPDEMQWRRNALKAIHKWLPIGSDRDANLPDSDLKHGEDFERIEEPEEMPEVAWFGWANGRLRAPKNENIEIVGPDGNQCQTPCDWPDTPPIFVQLYDSGWTVPVIADGALITPRPRDLTVEDILAKLTGFPAVPDQDSVGDGQESEAIDAVVVSDDAHQTETRSYPIRRMMRLLAPLSTVQPSIDLRDWSRWCKELRDDLCAMAEQEEPMLNFFRVAGTNPLPILCDPEIIPKGAERTELMQRLQEVAGHWDMADLPSLWDKESVA